MLRRRFIQDNMQSILICSYKDTGLKKHRINELFGLSFNSLTLFF